MSVSNIKIEIEQDGEITYTGFIQTVQTQNQSRSATVNLESTLQRLLNKKINYATENLMTPSALVADICELYKISYDSTTFGASSDIYDLDEVYLTANFVNSEISIMEALQQIAQIGVAAIYSIKGVLFFDVFRTRTAPSIYTFTDDHTAGVSVLEAPAIENMEKSETTGYSVEWTGTPAATLGLETDRGVSITGGADQNVKIMSLQAAVWIGETWLDYLNKPQRRFTFKTKSQIGKNLSLGYPIQLDYRNNQSETLDIFSIDNSSKVFTTIVGITR